MRCQRGRRHTLREHEIVRTRRACLRNVLGAIHICEIPFAGPNRARQRECGIRIGGYLRVAIARSACEGMRDSGVRIQKLHRVEAFFVEDVCVRHIKKLSVLVSAATDIRFEHNVVCGMVKECCVLLLTDGSSPPECGKSL